MKNYGDIISKTLITSYIGAQEDDKLSGFIEAFKESQKKTLEIMREGFNEWQGLLFPQGLSVEEAAFRIYAVRRLLDEFEAALKESDELAADTAESFTRLIKGEGEHLKTGFSITPTTHAVDFETGEAVEDEDDEDAHEATYEAAHEAAHEATHEAARGEDDDE